MEAWVTSAVVDGAVNKALLLAGSLRRVCTSKKLAVLTAGSVSKNLRRRLEVGFDLVVLLDEEPPNGWSLEEYAKVEAFSLSVFNKCVYLSPNSLVLKNCDEMFDKYVECALLDQGDEVDFSVFLFTPSNSHIQELRNSLESPELSRNENAPLGKAPCGVGEYLSLWIQKRFPRRETLDGEYSAMLSLEGGSPTSLELRMSIVNFGEAHPLHLEPEGNFRKLSQLGPIEKFVGELCARIYGEDLTGGPNNPYSGARTIAEVYKTEPIAIVGMSFRLPGGSNVEEFWDLLDQGKEGITLLPQSRWSREHTYLPYENQNRNLEAGFLPSVDEFDAKFFGVSGKEVEYLDPQQRILHEVAWEALEDAMIDPLSLSGTQTGVFVGSWLHDYLDYLKHSVDPDVFRIYMGNSIGTGAARLSYFLETTGPSIATESGCSSSMVAVDLAVKSLRHHHSNLALACGVNLLLRPRSSSSLDFILSPDARCKTFDEGANGYARAEGCGVLVMKRLSDAVKDQDNIWGLIRGSAMVQEGLSKSMGTPTVHSESLAMELALKDGNVDPLAVSYVEAHGTGTPVGDVIEVAAIAKVYSEGRVEPLVIGSVKTNVGHTESVSGITGIIKVLLAMKNERIPKHLNFKSLNPAINLNGIPAILPLEAIPWPKRIHQQRIAGINSFGITGTDTHVILQESPTMFIPKVDENAERPLHIFKISAKSPESFKKLLETYEKMFSEKEADVGFPDLAYSANSGRATFNHRAVIIAKDYKDAGDALRSRSFNTADVQSAGAQLCFLFTGQGSQYPNMAYNLFNTSPIFRDAFNKCDSFLNKQYGINLKQVLWGESVEGAELTRTIFSQTSIFCVEYCLLQLWKSWGVRPDFVMGHSLGEFAAAVAAGVLDFEDAIMLVAERSRLIEELPRGKMLVIQANLETVTKTIEELKQLKPNFWVDYAALNSANQTVVAGGSNDIEEFSKYCKRKSMKATVLAATHAFHSRHMEPMLQAYRRVAEKVKPPKLDVDAPKYISGMEGKLIDLPLIDAEYWVRHTREPVNFMDACKVAQSESCSLFLELGPHPVLSALTLMNMSGASVSCLPSIRRKENEWETMLGSLGKLYLSEWKGEVSWKGFDRYYNRSRVSVPFYPFNRKSIWKGVEAMLPTLHPLLGQVVPMDSDTSIFENRLTLKNTPFVQDHVIGNTVVFPGAAFLEMCLMGGYLSTQNLPAAGQLKEPKKPIALHSLKISSPLAFYESGFCRLQTSSKLDIEANEEISYLVKVSRHLPSSSGGGGEWIPHATGKFFPVPAIMAADQHSTFKIDIPSMQNSWQNIDHLISEFYENLPRTGLHFGLKFQSLGMSWQSEAGALFSVGMPTGGDHNYLIHPIVSDAMVQATMFWRSGCKPKLKLQVPVQIGEFIWLQSSPSPNRFVYCTTDEEGKTSAILLDEQGSRLAQMRNVDFMETSVKMIEGMIHQQSVAMPRIYEEIWKSAPGALQSSYNLRAASVRSLLFKEVQFTPDVREVGKNGKCQAETCNKLIQLYFLNALYEIGWKPKEKMAFALDEIVGLLQDPKPHFKQYIRFFLSCIAETGLLVAEPEQCDKWRFDGVPPSPEELARGLEELIGVDADLILELQMAVEVGRNLSAMLLGKVEALNIIFPTDPKKPNANEYYSRICERMGPALREMNDELITPIFDECYDAQIKRDGSSPPVLRVLEVGAGTGAATADLLQRLEAWGKPYELTFTDISPFFFSGAEKKFEAYSSHILFRKFNIETDALAQGFLPQHFDMIVAFQVLHVVKDIRSTLRNLKSLLKPGGIFQISETTKQSPIVTQPFGILEGYWQFQDYELRPNHTALSIEQWEQVLKEINCDQVTTSPEYYEAYSLIAARLSAQEVEEPTSPCTLVKSEHSWLLFCHESVAKATGLLKAKLAGVNRKVYTIERPTSCTESGIKELMSSAFRRATEAGESLEGIVYLWGLANERGNRDQSQISLPLINLLQNLTEGGTNPRLYVVTQGTVHVDGSHVTNPAAGTLHGMIKSFTNEDVTLNLSVLDLCPDESPIGQVGRLFDHLWDTEQSNRHTAFRGTNQLFCKLVTAKVVNNEPLTLPCGGSRFQLLLPSTRLISDLEFAHLENWTLAENEVEVQTKVVGLNFRDIFTILKPTDQFYELNSIGVDFAGVVVKLGSNVSSWRVGDRVLGMNMSKKLSVSSHIKIDEKLLVPLPPTMTFMEGATLPAAFYTATLGLIELAGMKGGDTVLIHTASGAVGLCAIQVAKRVGATVIATAGSKRKQNFLRNAGIRHVFHSRTTQFSKLILELTNGRGVDIVLNSITGEGFKEASLSALTKHGRFIEMSKLNIWSPEELKERRPDVIYHILDLASVETPKIKEFAITLNEFILQGYLRPLQYERFDALNIRAALGFMQKAKHIGKVVCVLPELRLDKSKITVSTPFCNPLSTYLVTGGLGGIGREVVNWMLHNSATHIAIAGRSPPKPEIAARIDTWNQSGKHVEAFQVDIGDYAQLQNLIQELASSKAGFPPLRGVMHIAGTLADATLENQSWSRYRTTYNPKVDGSWNLHELTKDLLLEHFVVFSSMAATLGSPGQSNHAASNFFEDSLVAYRRSNGLPGTTVNWGTWGETGVATEYDFPGLRPLTTTEGLLALETFLKSHMHHVAAANIQSFSQAAKIFPSLKIHVEDKRLFGDAASTVAMSSDMFWKDVEAAEDAQGKLLPFKRLIKATLKNMLKMEADEEIHDLLDFQSLGIDSLMMLELKNELQNIFGSKLSPTVSQLRDSTNTQEMASQLVNILQGKGDPHGQGN